MKTLSLLMRNKPTIEHSYRRTYGNANMAKRKDLRRIKKINIYNKQISGESNPNSWFIPKRLKAMANQMQTMKNKHVGTNPIAPEIQKQMLQTMTNLSEYQYYVFRNREQQLTQYKEFVESCNIDDWIAKMPAKLRKDTENAQDIPMPQIVQPILKYTEQLQVYLPMDQRQRYNMMLKIQYPPKAKLEDAQNE